MVAAQGAALVLGKNQNLLFLEELQLLPEGLDLVGPLLGFLGSARRWVAGGNLFTPGAFG
jgi:hypothetical protein